MPKKINNNPIAKLTKIQQYTSKFAAEKYAGDRVKISNGANM